MPPYNGSGTYTLTAGQPVVAGTDILDSTFNTLTADLATALSTCVTRDGQSPPTTNLPMGSFKLTGLSAGTANGHSVRFEQLQTGVNKLITVAGTGDVITGTMTPTYTAYATGDIFSFVVGLVNTTNVTINIDGLGAKAITVNGSTALVAGSLPANKAVLIEYDGTRFQLLTDNYVGAATGTLAVANGGTGVTTSTGSGANVLGTSPTLTTPTISTITSAAATALTLQSASTTAITVDTSQNVGIGTTSPSNKLDVTGVKANADNDSLGQMIVRDTTAYNSTPIAGIQFAVKYNTAGTYAVGTSIQGFKENATDGNFAQALRFTTQANADSPRERMRIDSSGNVGIGTTTPSTFGKFAVVGGNAYADGGYFAKNSNSTADTILKMPLNASTLILRPNGDSTVEFFNDVYGSALAINRTSVGIGTASPSYQLHVNTDSAGKPGVGGLWTVVSDKRIKSNIVNANLDRCYEIVKSVPLKHFGFAPGVYTDEQIQDKHNLGWIAQDVQKVFKNAVSVKPFTLKTDIPDGTEDYEEQDFTLEIIEKTETSIQVINGKPVQVSKVVTSENKVMLFDTVDVLDEAGDAVMDGDKPLTYQMPRMITKTRPKVRREVIEDCLDLNGGQMQAALYGAVQSLMEKIETLTTRITALEAK